MEDSLHNKFPLYERKEVTKFLPSKELDKTFTNAVYKRRKRIGVDWLYVCFELFVRKDDYNTRTKIKSFNLLEKKNRNDLFFIG